MVLENVISTKTLLSTQVKYYKFQYKIQNPNIIFQLEETIDVILMCLEILLHKHKAAIKVPEIVKQTVNRK